MRHFATLTLLVSMAGLAAPSSAQSGEADVEILRAKEAAVAPGATDAQRADLARLLDAARSESAQALLEVGPDGFGYIARDETEPGGPAYDFIDVSFSGTVVISADDAGAPQTLSFPFPFYGTEYTQLAATTNGYLSTDPTDTGPDLSNDGVLPSVPSTPEGTTGARIYTLHDDLITTVYYDSFTSCPRVADRGPNVACDIFQWGGSHFGGAGGIQVQAILYESGDFVFQYAGVPEGGSGSTVGIQSPSAPNGTGTPPEFGLAYHSNQGGALIVGRAILFLNPEFVSEIPVSFSSVQQAVSEAVGTVDIEISVPDTPDTPQDVTVTLLTDDSSGDPD
ncbi:MAG: hypothetical protein AAGK21_12090, partial [Bacteroidota bacterium]